AGRLWVSEPRPLVSHEPGAAGTARARLVAHLRPRFGNPESARLRRVDRSRRAPGGWSAQLVQRLDAALVSGDDRALDRAAHFEPRTAAALEGRVAGAEPRLPRPAQSRS